MELVARGGTDHALCFLCSHQKFYGSPNWRSQMNLMKLQIFTVQQSIPQDRESNFHQLELVREENEDEFKDLTSKSRFASHIVLRRKKQFIISPRELNSINYLLSNIVIKCTIYKLLSIYINIAHRSGNAQHKRLRHLLRVFLLFIIMSLSLFSSLSHWVP